MKTVLVEPLVICDELLKDWSAPLSQQGHQFVAYNTKPKNEEEWLQRTKDCEQIILANTPMPESVIHNNPKLRYINVAFTGVDHVPVALAKEKEIFVSNAAGYSDEGVAELVIGLSIQLLRKVKEADCGVRAGEGSKSYLGREICGKTVGIIGTGKIGIRTATLFKAFGAKVLGYSRSEQPLARSVGVEYCDLDTLLETADIVSVHLPLNAQTKGFLGAEEIRKMKSSAILINCARGPIIDAAALAEALQEGRIGGAGIDVYDTEPPLEPKHPLLQAPHTICTPHIAYFTEEAMEKRAKIVFDNAVHFLKGEDIPTLI